MRVTQLGKVFGRRALIGGVVTIFAWPVFAASPADQAKLVSADTAFAFGLLKELSKEQPAKNVLISPYSISGVLQMVCNGAGGRTRDQMAHVLRTSGFEPEALNQAYKDLDTSVRSAQTNVTLSIANAIWYSVGIEVKAAFASLNKDFYGAAMDALDFTDPRTGGIVNAWAENSTRGLIKNIISGRLPGDTRMLLANAVYFKGSWDRKFDPQGTKDRPFHLREGGEKQVPMMQQSGEFEYQEGNGCQAVRLAYAGRRLGMHVLLPEAGSNVNKLLATLNDQVWQDQLLPQLRKRKGSIALPRLKLEYRRGSQTTAPGDGPDAAPQPYCRFLQYVSQPAVLERGKTQELCRGERGRHRSRGSYGRSHEHGHRPAGSPAFRDDRGSPLLVRYRGQSEQSHPVRRRGV